MAQAAAKPAPNKPKITPEGSGTPAPPNDESDEENAAEPVPIPDDKLSFSASSLFSAASNVAISLARMVGSTLPAAGSAAVEAISDGEVSSSGLAVEPDSVAWSCSRIAIRFCSRWISCEDAEVDVELVATAPIGWATTPEPEGWIVTVAPAPIVSVFCRI